MSGETETAGARLPSETASRLSRWTVTAALTRPYKSLEGSLGAAWRVSEALGVAVVVAEMGGEGWRIVPATWEPLPAATPVARVDALHAKERAKAALSES